MKIYPRVTIVGLSDIVFAEVTCIDSSEAEVFIDEVRAELATLLGVSSQVARSLIAISVGRAPSIAAPMPECFGLSAQTRRAFAREVAGMISGHFQRPIADAPSQTAQDAITEAVGDGMPLGRRRK